MALFLLFVCLASRSSRCAALVPRYDLPRGCFTFLRHCTLIKDNFGDFGLLQRAVRNAKARKNDKACLMKHEHQHRSQIICNDTDCGNTDYPRHLPMYEHGYCVRKCMQWAKSAYRLHWIPTNVRAIQNANARFRSLMTANMRIVYKPARVSTTRNKVDMSVRCRADEFFINGKESLLLFNRVSYLADHMRLVDILRTIEEWILLPHLAKNSPAELQWYQFRLWLLSYYTFGSRRDDAFATIRKLER